jgi:hypothetical protein
MEDDGTTLTVHYAISTPTSGPRQTSALICVAVEGKRYCTPINITLPRCEPNVPTTCVENWTPKTFDCTSNGNGEVVFDLDTMTIMAQGTTAYMLCDGNLWGSIEGGGTVTVQQPPSTSGTQLTFDIIVTMPSAGFVSGQVYNMRLYLCDESGQSVCYLIPLKLNCRLDGGGGGLRAVDGQNQQGSDGILTAYSLFPNPVGEKLTVTTPPMDEAKNRAVRIQDQLGRQVGQLSLTAQSQEIDLSNYSPGVYFFTILENGTAVKVEKITVLR